MSVVSRILNFFSLRNNPEEKKVQKTDNKLKPVFSRPRYRCPFYGFYGSIFGFFMDSAGNQCALNTDRFSPCRIEMAGKLPDLNDCINFDGDEEEKVALDRIIKTFRIGPLEFRPPDQNSWKGLTFKDWYEYVMSEDTERP